MSQSETNDDVMEQLEQCRIELIREVKFPIRDIQNINVISSQDITLPLINSSTGRMFHTVRVQLE